MGQLISARAAAERLGVDIRTLYAYVSRGALTRVRVDEKRRSLYDADEVELLARRGRPRANRRPRAGIDVTIGSAVSTIEHGRIRYRGHDLIRLLDDEVAFEDVAELIWSGALPGEEPADTPPAATASARPAPASAASAKAAPAKAASVKAASVKAASAKAASVKAASWSLADDVRAAAARAVGSLDSRVGLLQRMAAGVLAAAPLLDGPAGDPEIGRQLVMLLAESAGEPRAESAGGAGGGPAEGGGADSGPGPFPLARRLWTRLSPLAPTAERVRALNRALVVLADHELATSTLAARIAASARASLPACLLAALGTLDGGLHGGVSDLVHRMLLDLAGSETAALDVAALRHFASALTVYPDGDPRVAPLLEAVRQMAGAAERAVVDRVVSFADDHDVLVTVDVALGALCFAGRMPLGAGRAVFATARSAGWIGHVREELDERPLRFRGRAVPRTVA